MVLLCRADPSHLGAHRFKIEGCAPFPPLALSFPFFFLLPLSSSLVFFDGETSQQRQGTRWAEETGR
ncbi:hypothetical protein Taro_048955 [Colocasia esculenta]|uniref:Uncharacterized protein n=1 Tax=Colocasia esculenta TaxID=4460 RepID=A0A843X9J8_COLES|nr:hypothetical protein [Colocasia esculenta]